MALHEVGHHAVAVEQALEENLLVGQARHLEGGGVLHPELVGGGAQHVARDHHAIGVEALAVGHHALAGPLEGLDGQPQLLGDGGRHAAFGQAQEQTLHARVVLGLVQGGDDAHDGEIRAAEGCEGA
jgi:hypothetical protein